MTINEYLGPLLGRAHEAHRVLSAAALAPLGISPKGFGALVVLASDGPLSQRRLAERQGIDRTTMVAVVDELERAGAVRRRRDERDRRAYALEITQEGERLLAVAHAGILESERQFLEPLAPAERGRLKDALRSLLAGTGDREPPAPA